MPLSEDDVREILRLIDESDVAELRIETDELSLHVVRDVAPADTAAERAAEPVVSPRPVGTGSARASGDERATIDSPMLGTFYRAPAPGAPPFVDLGARVEEETVVCLIEVMKMMNAVHAGVSGTIVEVCAENAELVEAGEALFRVERGLS
jgi:acetyl-CoA carboxylase biotin carboxyl carrier protein